MPWQAAARDARVGFPRFKTRHRDRGRVRFTTGAMRLEPDRRHLTVPVIGKPRSKKTPAGWSGWSSRVGRILSMTLSQCGGGLVVAVQAIVAQQPRHPAEQEGRCGVDLASASSGRSSPTMTAPSNGWRILPLEGGLPPGHPRLDHSAGRYGTVVVEDLDVAAMQRSMGRRAFRRTVSQAGIGQIRPALAYKCPALGGRLVLADRWFGSSKSHH
jgi:putative transposase